MPAIALRNSALVLVAAMALVAAAPSKAAAQYFAALSFSPSSGAVGWGFDFPSREEAETAAQKNCAKHAPDCRVTTSIENGCAAIAMGDTDYGSQAGRSQKRTQTRTMIDCRRKSRGCEMLRWICTTNSQD